MMFMCYSKRMASASFCPIYFSRMPLLWEMNLSRSVLWNLQVKIIKLSVVLKIWDEWYNRWIITQGAGTPCFFRMFTTVFLSYLKTNFTLKCLQTSLTCISLCQKCRDPSISFSYLRLMIGINFYVLCCQGRCDPTTYSWYYWQNG